MRSEEHRQFQIDPTRDGSRNTYCSLLRSLKSYEKLLFWIFYFFFGFIWVAKKRTNFPLRSIFEAKYFEIALLFAALSCDFCELCFRVSRCQMCILFVFVNPLQAFAKQQSWESNYREKSEMWTEFVFLKHESHFLLQSRRPNFHRNSLQMLGRDTFPSDEWIFSVVRNPI